MCTLVDPENETEHSVHNLEHWKEVGSRGEEEQEEPRALKHRFSAHALICTAPFCTRSTHLHRFAVRTHLHQCTHLQFTLICTATFCTRSTHLHCFVVRTHLHQFAPLHRTHLQFTLICTNAPLCTIFSARPMALHIFPRVLHIVHSWL